MSDINVRSDTSTQTPGATATAMRLEVVVVPVSDVDRAKRFYQALGWRLDADFTSGQHQDFRVIQLTPPGSQCSIIFGTGITSAEPGSTQSLILVVDDLDVARDELVDHGVAVSEVFHDVGGVFHHAGTEGRLPGPDPEGRSSTPLGSRSAIQTATDGSSKRSRHVCPVDDRMTKGG